jgi:hypothetical protein
LGREINYTPQALGPGSGIGFGAVVKFASCSNLESMASMGYVRRDFNRLRATAQLMGMTVGFAAGIYGLAHSGWTFLRKAIRPVP